MTDTAVRMLSRNPKGFFLHVEAGRIDQAHHVGNAYRALTDTIALSDAVEKTQKTLRELGLLDETLIIVTADHSHVFTIAGYPVRGNNILGKVIAFDHPKEGYALAEDHLPYATLSYANGPGFNPHSPADGPGYSPNAGRNEDLTSVDTSDKDFHQQSLVPLKHGSETHAGEDVAIYATGPQAYRFRGTLENNVIFHIMNQAFGFDSAGGR
jgi:alkaline phosphatase